jgi:hypothetical protein
MASAIREKHKPKGGIAAANKPDSPAMVNPAAANDSAFATGSTAKWRHFGHSAPTNATANNTMDPDPPAAVAVHPATANNANVLSKGKMAMTVGGSDSVDYGILSPAVAGVPSLSFNFMDDKVRGTNTMVDGEITSPTELTADTTGSVETTIDTAINAGGASAHNVPRDSLQINYNTPKKLNKVGGANTTVNHVITSPTVHITKTTGGVETTMNTATNTAGATTNPLSPDSVTPQKLNDISTNKMCPSDTNTHTVSTR